MIAEFLEVTFSRHGTCKLLCATSLALARSSPTRRYTGITTSERAQRAQRVLSYLRKKSEYSRPDPARPGPITLFKALYLRNRMSDRQAVFFDEYHLDVKVV